MNRSYNSSNTSPGFVYFNKSTPENKLDTGDFLAFNDPVSPQTSRFTPSHYSSPQPKNNRNFRNYPQNQRRYQRWSGGYNNSGNSSYNKNTSIKDNAEVDIERFYHPSFLEDPWAALEAKLKQNETEKS